MTIVDIEQANNALRRFIGQKLDEGNYQLRRIVRAMELLGNPQDNYQVVHVAGTSGKTSTAYYAASLLTNAGYKTGLTVSPHFEKVSERTQINLAPLPDDEYLQELTEFLRIIDSLGVQLSYFEVLVAFSYWEFDRQGVDIAVVEVGLGGLLDATNVVNRTDKICVITDIGYDHTEILGNTLSEIATQKAGIVHKNNTIWMHEQVQEVMSVITEKTLLVHAELHIANSASTKQYRSIPLFQQRNLALAYAATQALLGDNPQDVLQRVVPIVIPGRMQYVSHGDTTIILDGSHNEQKIQALVTSLAESYRKEDIVVICAVGDNKRTSVPGMLARLRTITDDIIFTEFTKGQDLMHGSIPALELQSAAQQAEFASIEIQVLPEQALRVALTRKKIVVITGSFYLLNQVTKAIERMEKK